jgi:hypothetical protein
VTTHSGDLRPGLIKALSVRQPWAELILSGRKRIEVRGWSVTYRGPVWLHAGQREDIEAEQHFGLTELFTGGFVGLVLLLDILPFSADRWEKWRSQHCVLGPAPAKAFAWMLSDPRRLIPPLPAAGRLHLFDVNEEMDRLLRERLAGS